jgi:hypothetical protein
MFVKERKSRRAVKVCAYLWRLSSRLARLSIALSQLRSEDLPSLESNGCDRVYRCSPFYWLYSQCPQTTGIALCRHEAPRPDAHKVSEQRMMSDFLEKNDGIVFLGMSSRTVTGPECNPTRIANSFVSAPNVSESSPKSFLIVSWHSFANLTMMTAWFACATGRPVTAR